MDEEVTESEKQSGSKGWKTATYLSLVVIIALIVLNIVGGPKQLQAGDIHSLVILPFDNFTGDDEMEYVVSGMHASAQRINTILHISTCDPKPKSSQL